jgi:hypothetical protein
MVVQNVIVQIGMALFVVPGLVLAVLFGFAPFAFAREGKGVFGSLGASCRAVSGHFLGVLGRMLLLGLVCIAIAIVPVLGWIAAPCLALLAWAELHRDLTAPAPAMTARPRPKPVAARPRTIPTPASRTAPRLSAEEADAPSTPERVH